MPGPPVRVAMVGTFDIENLGDLLFPIVAHHELVARLKDVELELFSYRAVDPPAWPLKVRPVHTLAPRLGEFDLLLVGGGHLVRCDDAVAPGYFPSDPATPHPIGLWLLPTLLAEAAGVPVAWNAVGTLTSVPDVLDDLVGAALAGVDYLAVRDVEAVRFVRGRAGGATPVLVPDTAYGVAAVLDDDVRARARQLLAGLGVDGGYVVAQPSLLLEDHRPAVVEFCEAARARGLTIVELPIGPVHLDRAGRLGLPVPTVTPPLWPEPLLVAAILAEAEAVVAASLHAGIVATALGVPLVRPRAAPGDKHEQLDLLPGVIPLDEDAGAVVATLPRLAPSSQVTAHVAVLAHHWDEVARHARAGRGARGPRPAVAELLAELPASLERRRLAAADALARQAAAHEVELRHAADTREMLASELDASRARADGMEAVLRRRSVRALLLISRNLAALRQRLGRSGLDHDR